MFMENKKCKICGIELNRKNKSGFCVKHIPRTGENNPFFGKKHSKETIENLKIKCKNASQKMWLNDEYREKVIEGTKGVKRDEKFKMKQRENAFKQFQDKKQREIRSKKMKESWQNGLITINKHNSYNESKQEKEFIELIENLGYKISFKSFHYIKENKKRYLFPDGIIENEKIIIEYNGSFWHADPKRYKDNEIIHHNKTAKEIREYDLKKIKIYEQNGYKVFTVWSDEFLKDKKKCINEFVNFVKINGNKT